MAYSSEPESYQRGAADLFAMLQTGVEPTIGRRYPLEQAAQAHADLEAGRTTGSMFLVPYPCGAAITSAGKLGAVLARIPAANSGCVAIVTNDQALVAESNGYDRRPSRHMRPR
jgi:hypothetical protein